MLKIRLRRMGSRHRPFYRVVVADSRKVPTAAAIDEIGVYNPIETPILVRIDTAKVEHWVARGAQVSPTVLQLLAVNGATAAPAAVTPAAATPAAAPAAEPVAEAGA